jgi:hypothetical protein
MEFKKAELGLLRARKKARPRGSRSGLVAEILPLYVPFCRFGFIPHPLIRSRPREHQHRIVLRALIQMFEGFGMVSQLALEITEHEMKRPLFGGEVSLLNHRSGLLGIGDLVDE